MIRVIGKKEMIKKEAKQKAYSRIIDSRKKEVSMVLDELETFFKGLNVKRQNRESIIVATDEALSNIIVHSYENQEGMEIEIDLELEGEELEIRIKDYGKKGEIEKKLEEKKKDIGKGMTFGGYGLVIMDFLMDELIFSDDKDANYLKMKKRIIIE